MKIQRAIITLIFIISLLSGNISTAYAMPPLPSSFYGTIKVDGANVADGTAISAWINGTQYAVTKTTLYNGDSIYALDIPGDDVSTPTMEGGSEGNTVVFHIGDWVADQTATWQSGTNVECNLSLITQFTLTVASNHGTVTKTPDKLIYSLGEDVVLKAVANTGWKFDSWSGGINSISNPVTVTMRGHTNIIANYNMLTYLISGNVGLAGVTLSYSDGITKNVLSDKDGFYSIIVPYQWSGSVIPTRAGYTFTPSGRIYTNLTEDKTGQDYTPVATTLTVSGTTQMAGVTLSYTDGSAKTVISGFGGAYSITVPYNWSGTITPSKEGYSFSPSLRSYSDLQANFPDQDFTPTVLTFTISGNAGAAGVTLSYFDGLAKSVVSDQSGAYSLSVSYNWSGTVTPSKKGYIFTPISKVYTFVKADTSGQDFKADIKIPAIGGWKLFLPHITR